MISIKGDDLEIDGTKKDIVKEWAMITTVIMESFGFKNIDDIKVLYRIGVSSILEESEDEVSNNEKET